MWMQVVWYMLISWWYKDKKQWKRRQQGDKIGRIYYAHPTFGEWFYLWMPLNVVKGPTSFEDIRTVDGTLYSDFQSACLALGLLEDEQRMEWCYIWSRKLVFWKKKNLCQMFATMLLFFEISNPLVLWTNNWDGNK